MNAPDPCSCHDAHLNCIEQSTHLDVIVGSDLDLLAAHTASGTSPDDM